MRLLANKRILVTGIASKLSIAKGIADAFNREGAELALTYQNDKLGARVKRFADEYDNALCLPCDLASDEQISEVFTTLADHWGQLDGLVHAVGYAPGELLDGNFHEVTTRDGFAITHDISVYSFIALAKAAARLLNPGASLLTLSYLGANQVLPNYNVMGLAKASLESSVRYLAVSLGKQGVRVNAISAGPIKTLAASGIKNFRKMLTENAKRAPLGRNVTIEEVGNTAAFLCSNYASGITGETLYVDNGFHIAAIAPFDDNESQL